MKSIRSLLALTAVLTASILVHAHPQGHDEVRPEPPPPPQKDFSKAEWFELFGGASLPVVWQSATASAEKITEALAAGKGEGIADWAETIHLASHALIDQVDLLEEERKKRIDAALTQAAKLADEVLDGAQHNETAQTAAAFKRLQAALNLAKMRLPKEITEAPAQTPRFAKAGKHEGDHKH
jgi:hypothetical protein